MSPQDGLCQKLRKCDLHMLKLCRENCGFFFRTRCIGLYDYLTYFLIFFHSLVLFFNLVQTHLHFIFYFYIIELLFRCVYRAMLRRTQSCDSKLSVCPSICLSATFKYRDHRDWNTSKIISRTNSLRSLLTFTPTWAIWCNGNTRKLGWKRGWGQEHENLQYLRNGPR